MPDSSTTSRPRSLEPFNSDRDDAHFHNILLNNYIKYKIYIDF